MATEHPLELSFPVVLDGSGNGSQKIVPPSNNETWRPFHLIVKTTSQVAPFPAIDVYSGADATSGVLLDSVRSAVVQNNVGIVSTGRVGSTVATQTKPVFVQFTAGTPADTVTIHILGTRVVV